RVGSSGARSSSESGTSPAIAGRRSWARSARTPYELPRSSAARLSCMRSFASPRSGGGRSPLLMRRLTRILLVPILLVPILWVWPQRGITRKFSLNTNGVTPAVVRVDRQINLDFMTAPSASLPQQDFNVEWNGWLRIDRDGPYTFDLR